MYTYKYTTNYTLSIVFILVKDNSPKFDTLHNDITWALELVIKRLLEIYVMS